MGAPILFIKKKDSMLQLCVDYYALNKIMIKNQYLLPLITKVLDCLIGTKVYTKLDIQLAYNLIQIKEGNKWKTVFYTQYSYYKYTVMLFGLANTLVMF